jgi:aminoglycoside phosphotransferase (APT) family kinase protein
MTPKPVDIDATLVAWLVASQFPAVGRPADHPGRARTLLEGENREAFRRALPLDAATWARGRGWALWKALIVFTGNLHTNPAEAAAARRVIDEVLAEHQQSR